MTGTSPKARPTRSFAARVLRRLLRVLLWSLVVLAVLLVVAWLFRRQLVEPLLRPQLEAVLADALGAERVTIGALDGNWITSIDVRDLTVEGGAAPVRELRGVRVQAAYSLLALAFGDFSGLRTATVTAARVELDLRPSADAAPPSPESDTGFDLEPYEALLSLCGDGAQVHVDELHLLAPGGEQRAALDVVLRPGGEHRELTVAYGSLQVEAHVRRAHAGDERVRATVDVDDPGAMLDLFGVGGGVREGQLRAEVRASMTPPRLAAEVDLTDLLHDGRRLQQSHIVASLDAERLTVTRATIDLPGVAAEVQELTLPSPFANVPSLSDLAGRFEVRIDDLQPHLALLPAELAPLLPIEGKLAGSFAEGLLQLDSSRLQARGADLQLSQGSFPLATDNWRDAVGSLQFELTLRDLTAEVPSLGEASVSGRIAGTLVGSLSEPELEVQLELGECRTPQVSFATAAGRVRADRQSLSVDDLQVRGLELPAVGAAVPTSVGLDATCRFAADGIDPDSLVANVDLGGQLPAELLAVVFEPGNPRPVPATPWTLHLEAQHGSDGISITSLTAHTEDGASLDVLVEGQGAVPVRWTGTALTPVDGSELQLRVTASRPADTLAPASTLEATLRLAATSAKLELDVQAEGVARLHGDIDVERGMATLLDAEPQFGALPVQIAMEIEELDLARVPPAWLGGMQFGGRVTGHVRAKGQPSQLSPDVALQWADGELAGVGMPAVGDLQLGLTVQRGDDDAETVLQLHATALLAESAAFAREVELTAEVRSDENGTRLLPTVLRIGGGEMSLELASKLRRSDLLLGDFATDRATLQGTIGLRSFDLDQLPPTLLGIGALRGITSGEIEVDGSLLELGPSLVQKAQVSLRDGELKASNLPRIEKLAAELTYVPGQVELASASGTIGAGEFSVHGTVKHDDLLTSFDDATVELQLTGQDLLLFRGDGAKVRASVDVEAAGTASALKIEGKIVLGRGSKYVRRISILPDLNSKGGAAASEGLRLVELPPEIGDRLTFDVGITTSEPFEVRTSVFDGEIDVAAALRGNGTAPRIEGTMSMRSGLLRFPGANLRVTSGLLTFTRTEPLFPELTIQAEGKRMGFVVSMAVTGRYDAPQVQLSSVPPLPPQDLIVLLTTGQLPSTLVERGAEGQARFVGGYLAQEVFETWFGSDSTERGESLFDRLTIETGREVSKNGTESVLVEYELWPNVAVQVERDAYEDYNLGLVLRFRFR